MQKNLTSIDLFKFIAAILVVCIHTHPFTSNPDVDYYFTCMCRIAVPFFFVFGSYMFFKSGKDIKTYVLRLLRLYAVWFVIEIPFIYDRFFANTYFIHGFIKFFYGLIVNNTFFASWYITATWQGTLVVYLLAKFDKRYLYTIGCICILLSVANAMYANLFDNQLWYLFIKITTLIHASNSVITAIPYIIIGRYIALNFKNIHITGIMFFVIISFCILECIICRDLYELSDCYLSLYPLSFFIVIYLIVHNVSISDSMSKIFRKMSILIYLIHPIIIHSLGFALGLDKGIYLFIIVLPITLIISYIIVFLQKRYKVLNLLN